MPPMDVRARLISPSNVAISPRYERSSFPIAARKLCPTSPSSDDCTKFDRFRYNKDGSASVCRSDIRGKGSVAGNLSLEVSVKGKFVVDKPCKVKGRSRRSAASDGSQSLRFIGS